VAAGPKTDIIGIAWALELTEKKALTPTGIVLFTKTQLILPAVWSLVLMRALPGRTGWLDRSSWQHHACSTSHPCIVNAHVSSAACLCIVIAHAGSTASPCIYRPSEPLAVSFCVTLVMPIPSQPNAHAHDLPVLLAPYRYEPLEPVWPPGAAFSSLVCR
jgi:hypothetical protein